MASSGMAPQRNDDGIALKQLPSIYIWYSMLHCVHYPPASHELSNIYKWLFERTHISIPCIMSMERRVLGEKQMFIVQYTHSLTHTHTKMIILLNHPSILLRHIPHCNFSIWASFFPIIVVVVIVVISECWLFFPRMCVHVFVVHSLRGIQSTVTFLQQIMKSYYEWLCGEGREEREWAKIHNDTMNKAKWMSRASDKNVYQCRDSEIARHDGKRGG